jgi:catechol 2,3-dioxygenase-like lactoylglutathione lyase family enzyme
MGVRGVDFVVVNVADIDAAVRFYREVAGVTAPILEDSATWAELDIAPVALALRHDTADPGVGAAIAFGVDDVDATIELLRASGRPVLIEPRDSGWVPIGLGVRPGRQLAVDPPPTRRDCGVGGPPKRGSGATLGS